jgi:biopolymer transport protein ExbD
VNAENTETAAAESVDGAYPGWGDDVVKATRKKKPRPEREDKPPEMPNITSLLDALFIILVFLLKSYSTSPVNVTQSESMKLVQSNAELMPMAAVPVVVDKAGIVVDGELVVEFAKDGSIPSEQVSGHIIASMREQLVKKKEEKEKLASMNSEVTFKGELIIICDNDVPFAVLRDVLMTAGDAEYGKFRFAVIKAKG